LMRLCSLVQMLSSSFGFIIAIFVLQWFDNAFFSSTLIYTFWMLQFSIVFFLWQFDDVSFFTFLCYILYFFSFVIASLYYVI
jgi:hypothetical protein